MNLQMLTAVIKKKNVVVPDWCLYVEIPFVQMHQIMVSSRKYFGFETTAFLVLE